MIDGGSDYLECSSGGLAAFDFGCKDFTIDSWLEFRSTGDFKVLLMPNGDFEAKSLTPFDFLSCNLHKGNNHV
jgi:hypothetical protein